MADESCSVSEPAIDQAHVDAVVVGSPSCDICADRKDVWSQCIRLCAQRGSHCFFEG